MTENNYTSINPIPRRPGRRIAFRALLSATVLLGGLSAATGSLHAQDDPLEVVCEAGDLCRIKKSRLPLRLLPRVDSVVYKEPRDDSEVAEGGIQPFSPLFVFERIDVSYDDPINPTGWFKVGRNRRKAFGYMKAKDALEWKNALLLSYTHPGSGPHRRKPVLMFKERNKLEELLQDSSEEAEQVYKDLTKGVVYDGIITREPDTFVDIKSKFYLLPVVDVKSATEFVDDQYADTYMLQLAAAVPNKRTKAGEACTTDRADFKECSAKMGKVSENELKVNIVYVMDLTASMQPFVEAVNEAMRNSARVISSIGGDKSRIRFGIIGYRDSQKASTANEFIARNYTKGGLVSNTEFVDIMSKQVKVKAGGDIAEEVYAGFLLALNDIKWDEDAIKMVVLVGDASSHEASHEFSTTKKSALELRQMASEQDVYVASIYIKNNKFKDDWPRGIEQFKELANNGGEVAFWAVGTDKRKILNALYEATATIVDQIRELNAERLKEATKNVATKAFNTGLVKFLGEATDPPPDITAWVYERDLTNNERSSFNLHVLVTRSDLDQLKAGLTQVLESFLLGEETSEGFFKTIQSLGTVTALDRELTRATVLAKTSIIPRWMETLPYKSKMMSYTFEEFEEFGPDEVNQMQNELQAKIGAYSDILENPDAWKTLNSEMDEDQKVYPLPLRLLP